MLLAAAAGLIFGLLPGRLLAASTATAIAIELNGFVIAVNVTSGGSGYTSAPDVTISGGGGQGATAMAIVTNSTVVAIVVLNAGSGYTSNPTVTIAPPQYTKVIGVQMVPMLTISSPPGTTNQILYTENLQATNQWVVLTNLVVPSDPYTFVDTGAPPSLARFYEIRIPEIPGPPPPPSNPNPAVLVWIPAGSFLLGSPDAEQDRQSREGPQTQVTITHGFWMSRYETTQSQYQAVMGSNPSGFTGLGTLPVENVSWFDATNYCYRLTAQERTAGRLPSGYVYRLPTEAEWEYACRAGTTTRFYYGDDPSYSRLTNYAWYAANSGNKTHPVGLLQPNAWGLYDMPGNVGEWCLDWFGWNYPGGSQTDPAGPSGTATRVIRGVGFGNPASQCRSAERDTYPPGQPESTVGFRPVLAVPQ